MRVLALYGIKGGVGKTSAAVNLAALAARDGKRTLLWDLDPQGAAGYLLEVKPKVKGGSSGLFAGARDLTEAVKATAVDGLDLLPADVTAREADRVLGDTKRPVRQLSRVLKPLREDYDLVVLDCPPGLSLLSENIFEACDVLLMPLLPAPLALRTFEQLKEYMAQFEGRRPVVRGFFSMIDGRKRLHAEAMAAPPKAVFPGGIPASSAVERMGVTRSPVVITEPRGTSAHAYWLLWQDLQPLLPW
ncbi:MAG: AAA family ATPase [Mycobacteriales bacterium]